MQKDSSSINIHIQLPLKMSPFIPLVVEFCIPGRPIGWISSVKAHWVDKFSKGPLGGQVQYRPIEWRSSV